MRRKDSMLRVAAAIAAICLTIPAVFAGKPQGDRPGGGKGKKSAGIPYVEGLMPLSDAAGIYGQAYGNVRPAFYDAQAPEVDGSSGVVGVVVVGASTANIFARNFWEPRAGRSSEVVVVNCGFGGRLLDTWADAGHRIWDSCRGQIENAGLDPDSEAQVVILKTGASGCTTISCEQGMFESTFDAIDTNLPGTRQIFLIDEGYQGWIAAAPGEPGGHGHGQAIAATVESSIASGTGDHWVSWAAYLWANGLGPDKRDGGMPGRTDGLEWRKSDFKDDGLHQSDAGASKEAELVHLALIADPVACVWYCAP